MNYDGMAEEEEERVSDPSRTVWMSSFVPCPPHNHNSGVRLQLENRLNLVPGTVTRGLKLNLICSSSVAASVPHSHTL